MKVYVGTYHKYNCGSLDGKWFDLDDYVSYDDFIEDCTEYHKDEEDPELMFQDYESEDDFDELFTKNNDIKGYIEAIQELERCKEDRELVAITANHLSWDTQEIIEHIKYISDYAFYINDFEEYFCELGGEQVSNSLRNFIDWQGYADYLCEDYEPYKDGFLIFRNY